MRARGRGGRLGAAEAVELLIEGSVRYSTGSGGQRELKAPDILGLEEVLQGTPIVATSAARGVRLAQSLPQRVLGLLVLFLLFLRQIALQDNCMQSSESERRSHMASITIRNLSPESKARLRRQAEERGCSLEALARSILDHAAEETPRATGFPHNLIALVEPGEDIEPFIRAHRQAQEPVDLT